MCPPSSAVVTSSTPRRSSASCWRRSLSGRGSPTTLSRVIVGVPAEVKTAENRVALTPDGVRELVAHGHQVRVERGAGEGSSIPDSDFKAAGADLVDIERAWAAQLVVKVKEPQAEEARYLRADQILFTYLHLAAYP